MPAPAARELPIDGSYGEGGGQIVRTAVSLSAITGRPVRIEKIRAARAKPGLAAQHLTSIYAGAAICAAKVSGATLGSSSICFHPTRRPIAGNYRFDMAEAREGGSAGAASLVLQTVAIPAVFASAASRFRILGGTHIACSPTFDYISEVWTPFLGRIGIEMQVKIESFGFFPVGRGEIDVQVAGGGFRIKEQLNLIDHGPLVSITGRAIAANLPAHIQQRMADHARAKLEHAAPHIDIETSCVQAVCPGAAFFLAADYQNVRAGFTSLGTRGKPSEAVAEEAVNALLIHRASGAALDRHLADQVLVPLALADCRSDFTCEAATSHLRTNAWVIEQFGLARVSLEQIDGKGVRVCMAPLPTRGRAGRSF